MYLDHFLAVAVASVAIAWTQVRVTGNVPREAHSGGDVAAWRKL
jgi:hypothetical protein